MLDLQAHNLDLINWFFGMPKYVSTVAKQCSPDFTGYGSISANLVYGDGLFVHSWCDWGVPSNKHLSRMIRINFEKGYLYLCMGTPKKELVAVSAEGDETNLLGTITVPTPGHRCEIEYFVRQIEADEPFDICPPEESAKVMLLMRAEEKSADQSGAPVTL